MCISQLQYLFKIWSDLYRFLVTDNKKIVCKKKWLGFSPVSICLRHFKPWHFQSRQIKTTSVNHVCPPRNRPSGPLFCVPHGYRPGPGNSNILLSSYSPHIRPYLWKWWGNVWQLLWNEVRSLCSEHYYNWGWPGDVSRLWRLLILPYGTITTFQTFKKLTISSSGFE